MQGSEERPSPKTDMWIAAGLNLKTREERSSGHVLQCGKVRLWSVPLEYLFVPPPGGFNHVVTVNAEIFVLAHQDPKLGDILNNAVSTIDGRNLQGICKLLYPNYRIERQNGSNFVADLARHCIKNSERLFLLGSNQKANNLAVQRMCDWFPGLQVAGFSPPMQNHPFAPDWNSLILKQLAAFGPRHLVVCFGPRKQEYWIHENTLHLAKLGVACAYGLGGTIDFLSGAKSRAPKSIEMLGAEWLFRLVCEPRARFRRTLTMLKMPFYVLATARGIRELDDCSGE